MACHGQGETRSGGKVRKRFENYVRNNGFPSNPNLVYATPCNAMPKYDDICEQKKQEAMQCCCAKLREKRNPKRQLLDHRSLLDVDQDVGVEIGCWSLPFSGTAVHDRVITDFFDAVGAANVSDVMSEL